jgi:hypothetical protein
MKTCLALYGPLSTSITIEYPTDITIVQITPQTLTDVETLASTRGHAHHSQRGIVTLQYYYDQLNKEIVKEDFDIIIYTSCTTLILSWPSVQGTYYFDALDAVDIISETHLRHRGQIYSWCDFPDQPRLLHALFKHQVVDSEHVAYVKHDVTFFIPSVISCSAVPFHYTPNRSLFTPNERLKQTCDQLQSIRTHAPDSHMYVLEGSTLTLSQLHALVQSGGDNVVIVLFRSDATAYEYANTNGNKSLYELYVIQRMLLRITSNWYFKFGGRYQMLKFDREKMCQSNPVYKIIDKRNNFTPNNIVECILYGFPNSTKYKQMHIYKQCIDYILHHPSDNVESILYKQISQPNYTYATVDALNVCGRDAICGFDNTV